MKCVGLSLILPLLLVWNGGHAQLKGQTPANTVHVCYQNEVTFTDTAYGELNYPDDSAKFCSCILTPGDDFNGTVKVTLVKSVRSVGADSCTSKLQIFTPQKTFRLLCPYPNSFFDLPLSSKKRISFTQSDGSMMFTFKVIQGVGNMKLSCSGDPLPSSSTKNPTTTLKPSSDSTTKPTSKRSDPTTKPTTKSSDPTTKSTSRGSDPTTKSTTSSSDPITKSTTRSSDPTTKSTTSSSDPTTKSTTRSSDPTAKPTTKSSDPTTKSASRSSDPTTKSTTRSSDPTTKSTTKSSLPTAKSTTNNSDPTTKSTAKSSDLTTKSTTKRLDPATKPTTKRSNPDENPQSSTASTKRQTTMPTTKGKPENSTSCPIHNPTLPKKTLEELYFAVFKVCTCQKIKEEYEENIAKQVDSNGVVSMDSYRKAGSILLAKLWFARTQ